ncbi:MAG: hypothetical protein ACOCWG_05050, partial [bacterium]
NIYAKSVRSFGLSKCWVTVTCMVSFGDSKHEPVKPLRRLLDVTPLILALSAKCTIHDVGCWCLLYLIVNHLFSSLYPSQLALSYPQSSNLFCFCGIAKIAPEGKTGLALLFDKALV